jgi:uncharacterized protein (TIGR03790 family)
MPKIVLSVYLWIFLFALTITESAVAALHPEEIVILVNTNSPDSIRIGELYTTLRKVPVNHLINVSVTTNEYISREDYDELIAKPVREGIRKLAGKGEKIRCILTAYGIPLRIGPAKPLIVPGEKIEKYSTLKKEHQKILSELRKQRKENKDSGEEVKKEINRLKKEIDNINLKLGNLKGADTIAAMDSELALLLMPDYSLAGWQPNPEHIYNRGRKVTYFGQILMVSRLDASTPELAEGLVHTAIEVEKTGLSGTFYLDARGLTGKGPYGTFDENIRETADILKNGSMPVVLDNKPQLFGPGEAPSAALYCGWYSLGKYRDAFEWSKGAIGYHVASSEAVSIHNKKGRYWVKSMIERGVIATLGPVREPYLSAFPLPSLFFQLLMSGQYSLAEVFTMTNPFFSWQMILIGDPLYNPFKKNPAYPLMNPPPPPE